jgi:hypothetical protein
MCGHRVLSCEARTTIDFFSETFGKLKVGLRISPTEYT